MDQLCRRHAERLQHPAPAAVPAFAYQLSSNAKQSPLRLTAVLGS
jgi:hypothetical protein